MAFFSGLSSTIGRKLLLYGLRHIDILDKDPADFVSVEVGKRTTLEVRDVGLHTKKLTTLLQLEMPPELRLSKARASVLRVTFVLDFGIPQITIEIDGIQVQARLIENVQETNLENPESRLGVPPAHTGPRRLSDSADDNLPTVDDLANSFIREEPEEELRELKHELETQSAYMCDSIASDTDDDVEAGMGAPLALPVYLRNLLNTALDRLSLVINNVELELQDQTPEGLPAESSPASTSPVSLKFHVERIAIDSVAPPDTVVENDFAKSVSSAHETKSRKGKRRLHLQNICARLISDFQNCASTSRTSRASSPTTTRSELLTHQSLPHELSESQISMENELNVDALPEDNTKPSSSLPAIPSPEMLETGIRDETDVEMSRSVQLGSPVLRPEMEASTHTVEDDRFADAMSDDGLAESMHNDSPSQSRHCLPPHHMRESVVLHDDEDERLLDFAMQSSMLDYQFHGAPLMQESAEDMEASPWNNAPSPGEEEDAFEDASEASTSTLPTVSALGRSFRPPQDIDSSIHIDSDAMKPSTDNLRTAIEEAYESSMDGSNEASRSSPVSEEDLAESQLFTHDDAESMYMSAVGSAQSDMIRRHHVPGGWESSSASSRSTTSDASGFIPDQMISGSILSPLTEVDEGCETPRPNSRRSLSSQPQRTQTLAAEPPINQAKLFFTIDELTIWFPLGLDDKSNRDTTAEPSVHVTGLDITPPALGEDSIFAEMPGSFSSYAQSSSQRRGPLLEESVRERPSSREHQAAQPQETLKGTISPSISIEVGSVVAHMDISTGRTMLAILNQTLQAVTAHQVSSQSTARTIEMQRDITSSVEVSIQNFSIAWLENVLAQSYVKEQIVSQQLELAPVDALLRVHTSGVHITRQARAGELRVKLQISTLVIASLDQDMVAFQPPKSRSRRSAHSAPGDLKNDAEIDFEQAKDQRITVVTRPVKVMFDIQKLDEALSSFGGFSGVLELSNSISSTSTGHSPVSTSIQPKLRGVHFSDNMPPLAKINPAPASMPKIQVQFGEVSFTLKGRTCAVQLQTTSIRIAVRESNVRLKISEIQLSGPYVEGTQGGAPLLVELRGSIINFLFAPEETDLARLISMITPSKDPYENDDDILTDTLLRQRRKGSVLRVEITEIGVRVSDLHQLKTLDALGEELTKLSKVAKYLPDDDRPGLLSLASIKKLDIGVAINEQLGDISVAIQAASVAHVGIPALLAVEVGKVDVLRDEELLIHDLIDLRSHDHLPVIMVRIIGDEIEPLVKMKLFNLCAEYRVSTVMAALGISNDGTVDDIALGIASSVATITGASISQTPSRQPTQESLPPVPPSKPLHIDILARNCALGLNPRKLPSKALFVLTEAHIAGKQAKDEYSISVEFRKASIHAIDDVARLEEERESVSSSPYTTTNRHLRELNELGFVSLSSISAAKVFVSIASEGRDKPQLVDVEFKNELFVLESCADSTQTLIAVLNGLQPPLPPSTAERYRTVVPLQEMMESFTGDAIVGPNDADIEDFMSNADLVEDDVPTNLKFLGSIYDSQSLPTQEELGDDLLSEDDLDTLASPNIVRQREGRAILESFQERYEVMKGDENFDFSENYFADSGAAKKGKAQKWDSKKNQYHLSNEFHALDAPLKVRVRDVNIIWNLYDGYDWPRTRSIFSQAVDDVEARAEERRRKASEDEEEDDFVEEDFLFNSVWIGVPVKDEKGALARCINHDIDDLASETGSYATSTATRSTGVSGISRGTSKKRRLKLERSKHKKIAFSIMGVAVDLIVYPTNSGETINSVDIRVHDLEIFDHIPTSTWKKFITCQITPNAREIGRPMINLHINTVKPVTELAASELVIKVTVLPLRLHVDQDALDFITRFFEFKNDSAQDGGAASEQPFIQRLEVKAVSLKLDYKPKRVNYRGLRSGHANEFKNFLILDGSDIVLRHAIVYGITSFDKLNQTLSDVWTPDVIRNQLPGVLSGLAAVRPIVNVGCGIRDLVVVPMREYKKDGRIVRSLQKGVYAFAKNTTSEVARLGAKVAIGTQTLLEGAEGFLKPQTASPSRAHDWDGEDPSSDTEEPRAVSHYANQPISVRAGLRSAARHMEHDILTARDAIIAIPTEVMEEGSGIGMAKALARHAPTVFLRPALGATKALSNALMGVGNALDEGSRRKIEDKYKSY